MTYDEQGIDLTAALALLAKSMFSLGLGAGEVLGFWSSLATRPAGVLPGWMPRLHLGFYKQPNRYKPVSSFW